MIGCYTMLYSIKTGDRLINDDPPKWKAAIDVTECFLLIVSALIIYSLGKNPQHLDVHVIRSAKQKRGQEEKKNPPQRYSSFNERNSGSSPFVDEPLSENSLNSPPVEIQVATRSLPSLT